MVAESPTHPGPTPQACQDVTDPLQLLEPLLDDFRETAPARDRQGGTPHLERNRIRATGLLTLLIPQIHGGQGDRWTTAFALTRRLARVDASLAHVLSYHYLGVTIPRIFGSEEQRHYYESASVQRGWWWGNALNPLDQRTRLTAEGRHYRLDGEKRFCSGSHDAEILPVTAIDSASGELLILVVPTDREGVQPKDDWDAIGQRQTDSGSVHFNAVKLFPREILGRRSSPTNPFQTIRACLTQLSMAHLFLGIAEGAFAEAKDLVQAQARLGGTRNQELPVIQQFGEFWLQLQGATALVEQAAPVLQHAWDQGEDLSAQERGACALQISAAKVAASRAGLAITSGLFELVGARSVDRALGLDRYWRNLRTLSLHDPEAKKIEALGQGALNGRLPEPGFYL
jgi:alkylation response protein AidB-like acyl-CoA dehydrogenase